MHDVLLIFYLLSYHYYLLDLLLILIDLRWLSSVSTL